MRSTGVGESNSNASSSPMFKAAECGSGSSTATGANPNSQFLKSSSCTPPLSPVPRRDQAHGLSMLPRNQHSFCRFGPLSPLLRPKKANAKTPACSSLCAFVVQTAFVPTETETLLRHIFTELPFGIATSPGRG
jgi:hypothetical protein